MDYDPRIHQRRSMRLQGYDYASPGAYFVTIVTYQRQQIFGESVNGVMNCSKFGEIVREEWMRSIGCAKKFIYTMMNLWSCLITFTQLSGWFQMTTILR